jgi:hypothetical protein
MNRSTLMMMMNLFNRSPLTSDCLSSQSPLPFDHLMNRSTLMSDCKEYEASDKKRDKADQATT